MDSSDSAETYHLADDGMHFYLTCLTLGTMEQWKAFALDQQRLAHAYRGDDLACKFANKGFGAFLSCLAYCGWPQTEVWTGFVADRAWSDRSAVPAEAIEMFVSMTTSAGASFTGHMGIGRSLSYAGERHARIAIRLHAFVARATLLAREGKTCMLTVPASRMRELMVHAFLESGCLADVSIGEGSAPIFLHGEKITPCINLDALQSRRQFQVQHGYHGTADKLSEYERNELAIAITLLEEEHRKQGRAPIVSVKRAADGLQYDEFCIHSSAGQIVQTIYPDMMQGELAWFFESPYFVRNKRQPLMCFDLSALGGL